jgi:tetratricopeptide (TPR) repeat protein
MFRKRQNYKEAIKAFESALASGDRSFSVHRDFAECLYREHRYKEAYDKMKWLLQRQPENIFILDQVIRIYIDSVRHGVASPITAPEAELFLKKLERFDFDERFIHHRKATVLGMSGLWTAALIEAEAACSTSHSPFEAYALKIDILIELGRFPAAEQELNDLGKRYRNIRQDVQIGTRCKLLIRQNKWPEAEAIWHRLTGKNSAVHQSLLRRILELKSQDYTVPLGERNRAAEEASYLRTVVPNFDNMPMVDSQESYDEYVEPESSSA